jgi:hypothetical protein
MTKFIRFARNVAIAATIIAVIGGGISWAIGARTTATYGHTLCYWSLAVGILSMFSLGTTGVSGYRRKPFISPDPVFMRWYANEEPFQKTMLSILVATVLDFAIGNLLMILFWG